MDNVQNLSAKSNSVVDRADQLLADNSATFHSTLQNADAFAKTLADNAPNIDVTLKNLADLSKTVQPVVAQIQSVAENADRVIKAVEPDQIHALLSNAQTFSQALADSSDNVKALARDGAVLAGHLNNSASRLDTALIDADSLLKAVNSQKIAGIVDSASSVVQTVRQNQGNINSTLKNFSNMSAKLNEFRRQGRRRPDRRAKLPWLAWHKGGGRPHQRGRAFGQETRRRCQLADKGHRQRPQPVHQYGLARIRGARG